MKRFAFRSFHGALLGTLLITAMPAMAQTTHTAPSLYGNAYQPVTPAGPGQAKIVYYRSGTPVTSGSAGASAQVYVDGEYHTSLLPGGFTAFCVRPGTHIVGSFLNDAPGYVGKKQGGGRMNVEAGQTYFARVDETNPNGAPQPTVRAEAERELADDREQIHVLSRASAVLACDATTMPAAAETTLVLNTDVLFGFNRSAESDLTSKGREALADIAAKLTSDKANKVRVVGHADLIGSDEAAQALGQRRANTVRNILIRNGVSSAVISAESAGNTEPVDSSCGSTNTKANVICNAPNRRVEVIVR